MRSGNWLTAAGATAALLTSGGADWPQFRGPGGSGVVAESATPAEWAADKNVAWTAAVRGVAWACPIVVGGKVFVATAVADGQSKPGGGFGGGGGRPGGGGPPGGGGRKGGPDKVYTWKLVCLDLATGKQQWASTVAEGKPKYGTHGSNTFASETPASDGERVYAYFAAAGVVAAYDLAGTELWRKEVGAFPTQANWGTSSSPVVHAGLVYVQCDNEEKSFLLALDAKTGAEKWRADRAEPSGWSTPYVWVTPGRTDLVVGGSQKLRGYDPATGKVVWELGVGGGQNSASPVGDAERLYFGTGVGGKGPRGGPPGGGAPAGGGPGGPGTLYAVTAGVVGDISLKAGESASGGVVWSARAAVPAAASPLVADGRVYVFERQGGLVSCYDAKTGKPHYTKERIPNAKAFWASPWAAGGNVFCLDEGGTTHVLKAGDTFEVVRANSLGKDVYWATPAVAGGTLVVRGVDTLYGIR